MAKRPPNNGKEKNQGPGDSTAVKEPCLCVLYSKFESHPLYGNLAPPFAALEAPQAPKDLVWWSLTAQY